MNSLKEKVVLELKKAKAIWKELVNNRQADVRKISGLFARYKSFLAENRLLLCEGPAYHQRKLFVVENLLQQYHEVTGIRDKKFLLNDVYVGLMFDVSESIDELEDKLEEDTFSDSDQLLLN